MSTPPGPKNGQYVQAQGGLFLYSVVGVRFKKAGKIYYFDPLDLPVEKEQSVIVETARGIEYGQVVIGKKEVGESDVVPSPQEGHSYRW